MIFLTDLESQENAGLSIALGDHQKEIAVFKLKDLGVKIKDINKYGKLLVWVFGGLGFKRYP